MKKYLAVLTFVYIRCYICACSVNYARNINYYYMDKGILLATKTLVELNPYATRSGTRVAYFPYVTLASGISINSRLFCCCFFSKSPTSSRFVELSEDDIYHFCEQ